MRETEKGKRGQWWGGGCWPCCPVCLHAYSGCPSKTCSRLLCAKRPRACVCVLGGGGRTCSQTNRHTLRHTENCNLVFTPSNTHIHAHVHTQEMCVEGLTRENVASHLQKWRMQVCTGSLLVHLPSMLCCFFRLLSPAQLPLRPLIARSCSRPCYS